MLVRISQQVLFFKLLLFAGFVSCSNRRGEHRIWRRENNVVLPPAFLAPSNPPFTSIQPDLPYQPDQPIQTYQPDDQPEPYQPSQTSQPDQPEPYQPSQTSQPDQPEPYQLTQTDQPEPYQPTQTSQPDQSNQPPVPNSRFGCQSTCTMAVSVSQDCLLYF